MERDYTDPMKILKFLIERNPFDDGAYLMNIETGEVSDDAVNVCDAKKVGSAIINNMVGQSVFGYSCKKLCRICGDIWSERNNNFFDVAEHKLEIDVAFGTNTIADTPTVHPKRICMKCFEKMQDKNDSEYVNTDHLVSTSDKL